MDESLHDDEQILRYLDGEMNAEEERSFAAALATDLSLRQRVESLQLTIAGIRQAGTAQQVQAIHAAMVGSLRGQRPTTPVRSLVRRSMAIAASIVFLLAAIGTWWVTRLSSTTVYDEHYIDYVTSTSRGMKTATQDLTTLYQRGEYSSVIQASQVHSLSAQDSLLTGLAYLQTGKAPNAIAWFSALRTAGGPYQQDADYYLAMAFLRNNEPEKAAPLLQQIWENPQHLYRQQVTRSLLWKVRLLQWK